MLIRTQRVTVLLPAVLAMCLLAERSCGSEHADGDPSGQGKVSIDLSPSPQKLIEELSSDSYFVRQQSREGLLKLGRPAIEPLEWAVKSEDAETRLRAIELLIELRGRGFLGIKLSEKVQQSEGQDAAADFAEPSVVGVDQVIGFYEFGATKPFPAETAGMQGGDTILRVNGQPIGGIKSLMREVIVIGPGRTAILTIERDGEQLRLPMTLTRNPTDRKEWSYPVDLEKELEMAVENNP